VRLTLHADYGLRTLVYLASHPGRVVPTTEIGRAYGISKHHLVRVAQSLRDGGFIDLAPGRSGGLSLARPAGTIRVGDVVRTLEPEMRIVECFDAKTNTCPIAPVCGLSRAVHGALAAFLAELDRFTIADAVERSGPDLRSHFLPVAALVRGRGVRTRPPPGNGPRPPRGTPGTRAASRTLRSDRARPRG
jgi:Rrf2 family nitric oxide-sensitive transcriptional repressor